jgi:hypothetical protein
MRNLILLNKASEAAGRLVQVCNQVSLLGEDTLNPDTGSPYKAELTISLIDVLAMIELLSLEYALDKDGLASMLKAKLDSVEELISKLEGDQSKSSDQSEAG